MNNYRIFVEKKQEFQIEAKSLYEDIKENIKIDLKNLRVINIYDLFNIEDNLKKEVESKILSEVQTDLVYNSLDLGCHYLAVEYLEGQFDQRADSALQCIHLIDPKSKASVRSGKLYLWENDINNNDLSKLKKYLINTVEAKEKDMSILKEASKPSSLKVNVIDGFILYKKEDLKELRKSLNLAMTDDDFSLVHDYFKNTEKRNPTETEIRVLDTYWSDHCRHQTFETILDEFTFKEGCFTDFIRETFFIYQNMKKSVNRSNKPITLMDMACINAKYERNQNNLCDLEISEENNACSIFRDCTVNGKKEKYLIMFKNETHNHPTEIEPYGGASTCIGGAIRDPLSGRSYVYQALRVTGAADITEPIEKTIKGKLPQRVISKKAASGYSSYGNQIGLATTYVREIFHDGYKAKRMEVGAVVGAVKAQNIRRETPKPGDVVILLGGKTGRDGIGGATGSSKAHDEKSVVSLSSEVQKGNAPEERKLQRLFSKKNVSMMIKKANDFGAGGVSVAIGELASGLEINLDNVPVKYTGLNGTELAISESQERMAVVVDSKDVEAFINEAHIENLEASIVATVTKDERLVMKYRNEKILDISRDFISTNGATSHAKVEIRNDAKDILKRFVDGNDVRKKMINNLLDLNVSEQKGLVEMFDSTIGAGTVLMPYGGKYQLTHTEASVSLVPNTETATIMAAGFDPNLSNKSPFHGAVYAVVDSLAKVTSVGGKYDTARLSFQEYFPKLNSDKEKWGKVTESLLGSIYIQKELNLASIGGKDSMSGTFNDLEVPETLISFALTTEEATNIISPEFKEIGNKIYIIKIKHQINDLPDIDSIKKNYQYIHEKIINKTIISANPIGFGGLAEVLMKSALGNKVGINISCNLDLFDLDYGSIVVETKEDLDYENAIYLGKITNGNIIINEEEFTHQEIVDKLYQRLEPIYPTNSSNENFIIKEQKVEKKNFIKQNKKEVHVFIPAFPGTNCDWDTIKAFEEAGAICHNFLFRNTLPNDIDYSISKMVEEINAADILVFSGGFSLGDEPDGSGKFIANVICEARVKKAIEKLLERKGLILGICNGFQALIKSGLLPDAKVGVVKANSPTLFKNNINRHVSKMVNTRISSINSPWLSSFNIGDIHTVAISHGEGKFVINENDYNDLVKKGLIAMEYCDLEGKATMDPNYNPNGSYYAIEGIISENGLILGKMGHSERKGKNIYKNINGNTNQDIFKNAVNYFKEENK